MKRANHDGMEVDAAFVPTKAGEDAQRQRAPDEAVARREAGEEEGASSSGKL